MIGTACCLCAPDVGPSEGIRSPDVDVDGLSPEPSAHSPSLTGDLRPSFGGVLMSDDDEDKLQTTLSSSQGAPSRSSSQPEPEPGATASSGAPKSGTAYDADSRPNLMSAAMKEARARSESGQGSGVFFGNIAGQASPPPATNRKPGRALSSKSSGSVVSMNTRFRRTLDGVMHGIDKVNGEPGDVERDPDFAYGEATLTFKDVAFSVRLKDGSEKEILAPTSGHFEHGSLVALMGPSGCGKTTLLDILANKKTSPWTGTVQLNGRPRDKLFERVTTYIPQDDIMPAHLTVIEMVSFYSALKVDCPRGVSKSFRSYYIEQRLEMLGLSEVRDTKIGSETVRGISGGQRRRVSLACGLSSMAQIFFADEPTSGLSGTDAEACVRYMRLLAKKFGITLIVAIHQPRPEVARLFDHLLLLTANPGMAVYNGPMRDVPKVLARVNYPVPEFANFTDFFLDLVTPGTRTGRPLVFVDFYKTELQPAVDDLVNRELNRPRKTALELLESRRAVMSQFGDLAPIRNTVYGVRFAKQLGLVFCRQLRLSLRDPLGIGMELAVACGQSVVIGITYVDVGKKAAYNQMLFYFMLAMTVALVGMKVMPKLVDERLVVKKETSEALYSDWAYILSFSIINTITGLIGNTIFIVLVFWMSSCDWDIFPVIFFWTTLLYMVMDSVYTMVAAIAKDSTSAMTLALPFLTLFLLYNGFTVYAELVPSFMRWLLKLSPVAYVIEQIAIEAVTLNPEGFSLISNEIGYKDQPGVALAVLCWTWVLFRALAVIFFKTLNNIRR